MMLSFFQSRTFGAVRSPQWPAVQKAHLAQFPTCAVCGEKGGLLNPLNVHHIMPFHLDPSKELDPGNLITLCHDHHLDIGHLGNFRSYNDTVVKDAQYLLDKRKNRP